MKKIIFPLTGLLILPITIFAQNDYSLSNDFSKKLTAYDKLSNQVNSMSSDENDVDSIALLKLKQVKALIACIQGVKNEIDYIVTFNEMDLYWLPRDYYTKAFKPKTIACLEEVEDLFYQANELVYDHKYYKDALRSFNEQLMVQVEYDKQDRSEKLRLKFRKPIDAYTATELFWIMYFLENTDVEWDITGQYNEITPEQVKNVKKKFNDTNLKLFLEIAEEIF